MSLLICATCANHYLEAPPPVCAVCADERQWVPPGGQRWTTLAELAQAGHRSQVRQVEPDLTGIGALLRRDPVLEPGNSAPRSRQRGGALGSCRAVRYIERLHERCPPASAADE